MTQTLQYPPLTLGKTALALHDLICIACLSNQAQSSVPAALRRSHVNVSRVNAAPHTEQTFRADAGHCCSVTKLCPSLSDPMNWTTPGFPVLHSPPELAQTRVHWVRDAIPPSHALSPPSPALSLSWHHGLLQWVGSSHTVAKVLELHVQHQSSNEYSGLISFRFELLAVQGTLKKLLMWCKISVFNSQLTNSPTLISPQKAQLTHLLVGKPSLQLCVEFCGALTPFRLALWTF